jgi:ParB/RepB/Spo0J family partition protein
MAKTATAESVKSEDIVKETPAERAKTRAEYMYWRDPKKIVIVPGYNVRNFDTPEMKQRVVDLAHDLVTNGQEVPIELRNNKGVDELISGETRLRAALYAIDNLGWEPKGIKAYYIADTLSAVDRDAMLIRGNNQKSLEPIEQAAVVARLANSHGLNQTEISKKTGLPQPTVSQLLMLYKAPEAMKKAVHERVISASNVLTILRATKGDEGEAEAILSDAVTEANFEAAQTPKNGRTRPPRVTAQHVEAATTRAGRNPRPVWLQKDKVIIAITALAEIYADTSYGLKPSQGYRGIAKTALFDLDVKPREWLKEYSTIDGGEEEE